MLSPYRRVLGLPGAWAFSMSGLVARLPISMVSLGIVLLVSTRTGSYAFAGAVSAAYLIANAAFGMAQGRLTDRLGQGRFLPVTVSVFTAAMALMMTAVELGWPTPVPHLLAAAAGAALPQIGSCVRARWSRLVTSDRELQTAFAFEAVVDEAVFVVGPTVVTFLATGVHPLAGLVTAVVAGLTGTLALAAQRSTEPQVGDRADRPAARAPMGWRVLAPLAAASVALGVVFGAAEVAAVAFSEELGSKATAGVLLAVLALGSLLSGFLTGTIQWRAANGVRFRRGIGALAVALLPVPFVEGFGLMGVALFTAGFTISPTLIAAVAWVEETVPVHRLTEGIAVIHTALGAGVAPGAALAGLVIDRSGGSSGFWVAAAAGLVGAGIALGASRLPSGRGTPRARVSPVG